MTKIRFMLNLPRSSLSNHKSFGGEWDHELIEGGVRMEKS